MKGWVYIITTKAMPSLVKIGFTTKDPEARAKELDGSSSPHPHLVAYDALMEAPYLVEQKAHKLLADKREGREWFKCSVEDAILVIKQIAGKSIAHETFQLAERELIETRLRQEQEQEAIKLKQEQRQERRQEEIRQKQEQKDKERQRKELIQKNSIKYLIIGKIKESKRARENMLRYKSIYMEGFDFTDEGAFIAWWVFVGLFVAPILYVSVLGDVGEKQFFEENASSHLAISAIISILATLIGKANVYIRNKAMLYEKLYKITCPKCKSSVILKKVDNITFPSDSLAILTCPHCKTNSELRSSDIP